MKLIYFFKIWKTLCRFRKCKKKTNFFFLFKIMALEPITGIYLNYDENTSDQQ